ncbi:sigma-54 dependent transcriptional regulator [Nannocystis sp. ILAH1]|uniref:sigma-54-dependent transcriptional regulator n=1 Tax=Nannocystis sp. ILAH1 TaxID=2996789 RepID=UPI00226D4EAF|nr:sigma-54 dependent transcriptional regulator [Nannocystis sp. ILAH1]MCY0989810.1 sigma-54 dependent transcriptional regulator [Nannocystis sp. ILAH1]
MSQPSSPTRILDVDDEPSARAGLTNLLRDEGYDVQSAGDGFKALGRLEQFVPDIVLTDVRMPALGGMELLARLREQWPRVSVVVMSGYCTVEGAVEAMRLGADDYLQKPLDFAQVLAVLQRVVERRALAAEADGVRSAVKSPSCEPDGDLIGHSRAFREVLELAGQVAAAPLPVLITGERGTGKRSLARRIHQWSRRSGSLISLCCSTTDEATLQRELFGPNSRLLVADGGSLLLADIDALSLPLQGQLLRFLQQRSVLGSDGHSVTADVRLLASTSRDLATEVKQGRFRQDLFDRLDVIRLRLPPLRERREDVTALAAHFVKQHARRLGKRITGCTERVLMALFGFDWPGNVRQLESCIERAIVVSRGPELEPRDLPREAMLGGSETDAAPSIPGASLREIERYAILQTLEHTGGSTSKAAKILGISARKIQYRLNEYGASRPQAVAVAARPAPRAHATTAAPAAS